MEETHIFLYKRAKRDVEHISLDMLKLCEAIGAHIYSRQTTDLDCERILCLLSYLFSDAVFNKENNGLGLFGRQGLGSEYATSSHTSARPIAEDKEPDELLRMRDFVIANTRYVTKLKILNSATLTICNQLLTTFIASVTHNTWLRPSRHCTGGSESCKLLGLTERARVEHRASEGIHFAKKATSLERPSNSYRTKASEIWQNPKTETVVKKIFASIPERIDLFGADEVFYKNFSDDVMSSSDISSFVGTKFSRRAPEKGGEHSSITLNDLKSQVVAKRDIEFNDDQTSNSLGSEYLDSVSLLIVEEAIRYNKAITKMRVEAAILLKAIEARTPVDEEHHETCCALIRAEVPKPWGNALPNILAATIYEWMEILKNYVDFFQEWAKARVLPRGGNEMDSPDFPPCVNLAAFARPLRFIACIEESFAVCNGNLSLDDIELTFQVIDEQKRKRMKVRAPSRSEGGCYVEGMSVIEILESSTISTTPFLLT